MRHKVTDVVYRRFNKHLKVKKTYELQIAPNTETATPTEYCPSVSLTAENVRLDNKHFLTSTRSTSTSTSTQKLY